MLVPVFVDLADLSIVGNEYKFLFAYRLLNPQIPIPVGYVLLALFMCSLIGKSLFRDKKLLISFVFCLSLLFLLGLYNNLSLIRTLQICIPLFVFLAIALVPRKRGTFHVVIFFMSLFGLWIYLHFLWVLYATGEVENVYRNLFYTDIFGTFWRWPIYQSLITYTSILSWLLGVALLSLVGFIFSPSTTIWTDRFKLFIVLFLLIVLSGFLSGRRVFLLDFVLQCSLVWFYVSSRVEEKRLFYMVSVAFSVFIFLSLYISGFFERFFQLYEKNMLDGNRLGKWVVAFDQFSENPTQFFLGFGVESSPGFHSLLLDVIAKVGVVGFVIILFFMIYSFKSRWVSLNAPYSRLSLSLFLVPLVTANLVNSNLLQPYFLLGLFVFFFLYNLIACIGESGVRG
jgi:hypothetical protein